VSSGTQEYGMLWRSGLVQVVSLLEVMPCRLIIEWIVKIFNVHSRTVGVANSQVFCDLTPNVFQKIFRGHP